MEQKPRPPVDPRVTAAFDEMTPYAAVVAAVGFFGAPTEVMVPIVRRLRGRTGVSTGPGLVILANALAGLGVVRFFRQRPERWARLRDRPPSRWLLLVPIHLLLSPIAAASWERAVVLRHRSALWGGVASPVGALQIVLLAVTMRRAQRAKRSSEPTAGS